MTFGEEDPGSNMERNKEEMLRFHPPTGELTSYERCLIKHLISCLSETCCWMYARINSRMINMVPSSRENVLCAED